MRVLTALEIGALLWPDKPAPGTPDERRNYTGDVRKWLKRRGIVSVPGRCGPRREAVYPAALVEEALVGPRGRGNRLDGDSGARAVAARLGWETRKDDSPEPRA